MPNFSVFNFDADVLRTKIFGSENVAIRTDADGRLEIASISDSITVTATNLDIRDLCANQDNVLTFGFDGANVQPVRTDAEGRLEIRSISDSVTVTATNLDIRDLCANQDNVLTFGFDGTNVQPVRTDTEGRLEIRSISDSVTVTATNLDIRDLCANQDNVLTFGFDGANVQPVRTDAEGRLEIRSISDSVTVTGTVEANTVPDFNEVNFSNVTTGDAFTGLSYVDTSTQTMYTFFVYNKGANSADVRLDISPDQVTFFTDVASRTIASGATDAFVAKTFLRYTRLSYRSSITGSATTLDVFFQTQST